MTPQPTQLRRSIAVFGSSTPREGDSLYSVAYEIGHALAVAGYDLVNGGHEGTMEASARGAQKGGARVVGVSCAPLRRARGAMTNNYLDEVIDAQSLLSRLDILLRSAAGFVVLEGGTGTLAEFGVVWEHVSKGLIPPAPIILVGELWTPAVRAVMSAQSEAAHSVFRADSADEVVKLLQQWERGASASTPQQPGRQP